MLSYFGCDQSQVQRYLTARSVDEGRQSLLMSAYVEDSAAGGDPADRRAGVRVLSVRAGRRCSSTQGRTPKLRRGAARPSTLALEQRYRASARSARRRGTSGRRGARGRRSRPRRRSRRRRSRRAMPTVERGARGRACAFATRQSGRRDIQRRELRVSRRSSSRSMPIGLVGLLIAAIFAAAMSTIAAELNCALDRHGDRLLPAPSSSRTATDAHYLTVSRVATGLLGPLRLRRRDLRRDARLADRGGEPVRIVLLRIDARRVRPGDWNAACKRHGRLRRPDCGDERGGVRRLSVPRVSRSSGTTSSASPS